MLIRGQATLRRNRVEPLFLPGFQLHRHTSKG
jgi:hypothetical protein